MLKKHRGLVPGVPGGSAGPVLYDFIICCATFNIFCSYMIFLPVVQQSNAESVQVVSKSLQLSVPHTKLPEQSISASQSPQPWAHGNEEEQQLQSSWLASQSEVTHSSNVF